ncbi:hypothetical protein AB9F29_05760 [Falsihalocynthiibacter sp. S25ZX9]|uniref:hypothetical protein n=1 Tax=Falsihalocynthiibacter sp. S25ZX9 TaxID=3240870 RepID=UPI00350FC7C4
MAPFNTPDTNTVKEAYAAPTVVVLGDMVELTASGSNRQNPENSVQTGTDRQVRP